MSDAPRSSQHRSLPIARASLFLVGIALAACGGTHDRPPATPSVNVPSPAGSSGPLHVVPQVMHGIHRFALSPDGRLALTRGDDDRAKLWDVERGILLRSFGSSTRGRELGLASAAFTPDGTCLLEGAQEIRVWSVDEGARISTLEHASAPAFFSPDGARIVAVGRDDRRPGIWNTRTGKRERTFGAPEAMPRAFARGMVIASLPAPDQQIVAWDTETGAALWRVNELSGDVAVSGDGKLLAVGGTHVAIVDIATGRILRSFGNDEEGHHVAFTKDGRRLLTANNGDAAFWEVDTGAVVRTLGHGDFRGVVMSADGTHAGAFTVTKAQVWDAATGQLVRAIGKTQYEGTEKVQLAPRGNFALVSLFRENEEEKRINVWNLATGALTKTLTEYENVAWLADGRHAASQRGIDLDVWDVTTGAVARRIRSTAGLWVIAESGMRAVQTSNSTVTVWNLETGGLLKTIQHPLDVDGPFWPVLSRDGRRACTTANGDTQFKVRLWDLDQGVVLRTLTGPSKRSQGGVTGCAFSPDARHVLTTGPGPVVRVWDVATGRNLRDLDAGDGVVVARFSKDGKRVLTGSDKTATISVWDTSGAKLASLHADPSTLAACGSVFAAGDPAGGVFVFDAETGKVTQRMSSEGFYVRSLSCTEDGRHVMAADVNAVSRVWRIETGTSMMLMSRGNEWLMTDDSGRFDASRRGGELVALVRGVHPFRIDQRAIIDNRPDLVLQQLDLGSTELRAHFLARHERRLKRLGIAGDQEASRRLAGAPVARVAEARHEGKSVELAIELSPSAARYNVYVNGVALFGGGGKAAPREQRARERVELTSGTNNIEVSAFDAAGVESLRELRSFEQGKGRRGDLYFLGFGVSHYKDSRLDLSFAHKDARDLAAAFERLGAHYDHVHVKTLVDNEVTVKNIVAAKDVFQRAAVDDTVVLFVAGHGTHTRDATADYYYVTHDTDVRRLRETAADFALLEDLLDGIPARRKLMLLDTCESGERDAGETAAAAGPGSRGLRARAPRALVLDSTAARAAPRPFLFERERYIYNELGRRSGATVFASSRGAELSYELDELQNGAFTHAVVEALTAGRAVTTDDLRAFVAARVAALTGERQHPTIDRDNVEMKFGLIPAQGQSAPSPVGGTVSCPQCGHMNTPTNLLCGSCGFRLPGAPAPK